MISSSTHRHFTAFLSAVAVISACTRTETKGASSSEGAADTTIVRGAGVPNDPDDTSATRYQVHYAPRGVAAPDCLPSGIALCIADTARTFQSGDVPGGDGGMNDSRTTAWLVFATSRDSIQLFLVSPGQRYIKMAPRSAAGFSGENSGGVDASWIRARFPRTGSYVFTASLEGDLDLPYELRVAPVITTGATRPVGKSATLTVAGDSAARFAVAPLSLSRTLSPTELEPFGVRAGTYRVLFVRDTSYVACKLPCASRNSFTLHPGQTLTIAP